MLSRQRQLQTKLHKLLDAAIFGVAFWLAHWLRSLPAFEPHILGFSTYRWLLLVIIPLAPPVLELQGFYRRPLLSSRTQTIWQLAKAATWISFAFITVLFFSKNEGARGLPILFIPVAAGLIFAKEELGRHWAQARLGGNASRRRVIVLGSQTRETPAHGETDQLENAIRLGSLGDIEVVAHADLHNTRPNELANLLHDTSANAVIISPRQALFGDIEQAIQICELEGVEVWLLADFFQTRLSQTTADDLNGHPVLVFRTGPDASWQALAKTAIDFVGALLLLICTSPVILLAAIAVKLTSPGPVLFRQQRAGLNGQPFTMLKFRTMVTNAEQLKQELAQLNEMTGPVFKVTNDPRITRIGRHLRRYSIDELPQLWNVLSGEMSLVGPRPLPVDEVRHFDDPAHRRRLSVKPGLTCLWQVSGRNNVCDFQEWVRLDLEYIDNWSLWLDIKILVRTVPAVFAGAGAK